MPSPSRFCLPVARCIILQKSERYHKMGRRGVFSSKAVHFVVVLKCWQATHNINLDQIR